MPVVSSDDSSDDSIGCWPALLTKYDTAAGHKRIKRVSNTEMGQVVDLAIEKTVFNLLLSFFERINLLISAFPFHVLYTPFIEGELAND